MVFFARCRIARPTFCLACGCLSPGLLVLLVGCGEHPPRSVKHTEVSGTVRFQGEPLPGGVISFVAVNGGFAAPGIIDANGHYQVKAPVGEVQISVSNRVLQTGGKAEGVPVLKKAAPQNAPSLEGRYVEIPAHYEDPRTSGLKYTVRAGPQTHDIELSVSAPGSPKP